MPSYVDTLVLKGVRVREHSKLKSTRFHPVSIYVYMNEINVIIHPFLSSFYRYVIEINFILQIFIKIMLVTGTGAGTVWRKIRSRNLNRNRVKMARFRNTAFIS
jgi:hypothetical protein